jgi:hypothetical protein
VFAVFSGVVGVGVASASGGRAWWSIEQESVPTHIPTVAPAEGVIVLRATDIGDAPIEGASIPVRVSDVLPAGLKAIGIEGTVRGWRSGSNVQYGTVSCVLGELACTYGEDSAAFNWIEVTIHVKVENPVTASGENDVSVSGGGGAPVSREQVVTASDEPAPFGIEPGSFDIAAESEGGVPDTQAGSHPFQLTTAFTFNNIGEGGAEQVAQPRNLRFQLPAGLVGNAQLMPRCKLAQFDALPEPACPADTALGVAVEQYALQVGFGITGFQAVPVFNLEPAVGEPARFGFNIGQYVYLTTSVRTGGDYGVTVKVSNITQQVAFSSSIVTLWGAPNSPAHNGQRGNQCLKGEAGCQSEELRQVPFLTLPDSCRGFQGTMVANAWTLPEYVGPIDSTFQETLDGCNQVPFEAGVEVAPDVQSSSSTSGLTAHVKLPQSISEDPEALGEGTIKDTTVALPAGVQLNPSDSDGLEACSESQIGYLNETGPNGELQFTGALPAGWEEGEGGFCPKAAKIGTVSIATPLLKEPVKGAIYLATPAPNGETGQNPFNTLLAMYLVAEDKEAGVAVKLPGHVTLCKGAGETVDGMVCGAQGQLITTFQDTPELPFSDLELHFFGGERSPLSTPAHCGSYTTQAVFTPWSGGEPVHSTSTFDITSGPHGSSCPGVLPFEPSLTTGTTNNNAGGFSPFTLTMSREDGNQNLQAISLKTPPGLSGILNGVELCGEAQANAGTCGPNSQVGETTVSVGVGNEPYTVTGGKVYLTGPYEGAPFGLSIVNPANAGPFHLGNVIVRAKIEVNPTTAALTVTSDNSGPYKIPQYIDGIPLEIKHINVTVGRAGFTFNPSSCEHMAIEGSLSSTEGATKALSVPFQATNCASLKFTPKFSASTSGKTSKADGASLTANLSEPSEPQGSQANIAKVKVELPKQLPSRLTTLQKACTNAQFETNPAGCPAESKIGYAVVHTPLLPVPLTGPAIFVSHGGEAFPSLTMVLQGYGVTVDLVGTTFISKAGVTSTTFKTVPDVPFNTFTLTLPQGPYSALTANGNLCTSKLTMPTEFLAQNGVKINESTPVTVTGCPKSKALTRAQKLKAALKACHKKAKGSKRKACERAARKKYGPVVKRKGKKK